jgi:hypothetical protein
VAYARFGDESDVYVFLADYLVCQKCCLTEDGEYHQFHARTTAQMVRHLDAHLSAGHRVPPEAIAGLLAGEAETDAMIAGEHPESG